MIARGIEAGWPRRPAARFTRARCGPNGKATKTKFWNLDLLLNFCLRVIDSNLKHWETFLQFFFTCRGAVAGSQIRPSVGDPLQARDLQQAVRGRVLDSKP
jgi:hypothetical protein